MREVPAAIFGFTCRALARYGVDTAEHMRGLRLAEVDPERIGERVDWDELAEFWNRATRGLTNEEQEALGELYPLEDKYLHIAARTVPTPRLLMHLIGHVTRASMRHMDVGVWDERDGAVRFEMAVPSGYLPCTPFFRSITGEWRGILALLGGSGSAVEAEVGPWRGSYRVVLPPSAPPSGALSRAGAWLAEQLGRELASMVAWILSQDASDEALDVEHLRRSHGLTWAEAHVAVRLARGEPIEQVAGALGLSDEAVRGHLQELRRKTGAATPL
jgi:DNA-binding CsgD family transcriptional regulator